MSVRVRTVATAPDKQHSLEIYNEVWPQRAVTPADVEAWEQLSVATVELLADVDGPETGSAASSVPSSRPHVALLLVTVLPQHRRRGAGAALFDELVRWATAQGVQELEAPVALGDDESLAFGERRGLREASRNVDLELRLADVDPPRVDTPDGVEIVLLAERPDLVHGVYAAGLDALPDIPGSEGWKPISFEQFTEAHLRGLSVHVAIASDEVVGYAKLHAGADGTSAEHGMTAVTRAWRGRGIASSLKRAQIDWAKANGLDRLTTENDERNAPMRRINEALGYRETTGWILLHARVADLRLP